jgi:hypothetical protein
MAPAEQSKGKGKEKERVDGRFAPYKVPDRSQTGENSQAESSQNPQQKLVTTERPETWLNLILQPGAPQPGASQPSALQPEALQKAASHDEDPAAREAQVQKKWNGYFPKQQKISHQFLLITGK